MAQIRALHAATATAAPTDPQPGTAEKSAARRRAATGRTWGGWDAIPGRARRVHVDAEACGIDIDTRQTPPVAAITASAKEVPDGADDAS
ncbi:hypothetical protein FOMPIDRAFT_1024846 [Fomitopsis schrenkii]|uniref:Uncharacterized protein n=1 Tax=Fomitopsis schrenkii TaxID=2126942 RepID=S8FHP3_FOMSC|nr:hypothetical protein FOMPIDRAFT_1024846 [Fomitopsis schrenkii]